MFLVFNITEAFGTIDQKIEVSRSFASKEVIKKEFIDRHQPGQTISEEHKLLAYGKTVNGSEVLAVNRNNGACNSIAVLHIDQVNEI